MQTSSAFSLLIGFMLSIAAGAFIGLIFHFLENINKKKEANKVYNAMLKRLERMKQIMENHKDGKPYAWPEGTPEQIKKLNPSQVVIEKYSHLVKTENMLYSLFNAHLYLLSEEIIGKIDNLHDSIDPRTELTDRLQSKGVMHEVVKLYSLVTDLTELITKLRK